MTYNTLDLLIILIVTTILMIAACIPATIIFLRYRRENDQMLF